MLRDSRIYACETPCKECYLKDQPERIRFAAGVAFRDNRGVIMHKLPPEQRQAIAQAALEVAAPEAAHDPQVTELVINSLLRIDKGICPQYE